MKETERLSDEAWLQRACVILDKEYGAPQTGSWTPDTALNEELDYDLDEISEAIWAVDPEKSIDLSAIDGTKYTPSKVDVGAWLMFLSIFAGLLWVLQGLPGGVASAMVAYVLVIVGGTVIVNWDRPRWIRRNKKNYPPLRVRDLLEYRGDNGSRA
jgi:hypothetical protein